MEEVVEPFKKAKGLPIGWVYSDFDDIDGDGKVVSRSFIDKARLENPKRHLAILLGQGVIIQPCATLIIRAAFQAVAVFDERMCGYEDDDLFLRIFHESFDNVLID